MLTALISALAAVGQAGPPPIPTDAKPHTVVGDIAFAEGPIFDREGNLYFVNYHHIGSIGRRTPDGAVTVWCETGGRANGLKVDAKGFIVAADFDGKRILRIPPSGSPIEVLTSEFEGKLYQGPNDVCLDHAGNVYFSDPGNFQTPTSSVYRIATDGTVTRVAGDIAYPNGLAVSPDQTRLYVAESATNRLLAWDLAPDGPATNRRVVRQFPDETLDGMMFDEFGRLWIARWTHGTVDVVTQGGELLGSIPTGGTQVTNLCWWGTQLHVTVAGSQAILRFEVGCRAAP